MTKKTDLKYFAYLEGGISIIINTVLFALKMWAGISTRSISIIADAWHTLSDSLTSIIVIFGVKLSHKPADKEHPFGHGRIEVIASLFIGTFLLSVGFRLLLMSITNFKNGNHPDYNIFAIAVVIVSIIMKELIARFSMWAGEKCDSKSLKAEAWHHRSDALSSVIVLIGIFLGPYFWWIDGLIGILISFFLFYVTYQIIRDSSNSLIGTKVPDALYADVLRIAKNVVSEEIYIHHLHLHDYGGHNELIFHIALAPDMKLSAAHEIADKIEKNIHDELEINTTIHIDPLELNLK